MPFHNPYHFVPVIKDLDRSSEMETNKFRDGELAGFEEVTHDRYVNDRHSGRIICRLTTESPIFIGSDKTKEANTADGTPAEVGNYKLDGLPAIPATTIRGALSSIFEAATNSTLRVLEKDLYSYRQGMRDSPLSAIGMVVKKEIENEEGEKEIEWRLKPLTLPVMQNRKPSQDFQRIFASHTSPNLRVYIWSNTAASLKTYTDENNNFYYLRMKRPRWSGESHDRTITGLSDDYLKINRGNLLSQFANKVDNITEQEVPDRSPRPVTKDQIPNGQEDHYVRGILRIMSVGSGDSKRDFPPNRKYEVFIPYPESEVDKWDTFKIHESAIDRFRNIADQRTKETEKSAENQWHILPYHPKSTKRNTDAGKKTLELKEGDLVFFKPNLYGNEIVEISFSSIWRRRVADKNTTSHDFFGEVESQLVPFHKDRERITAAERLFGFVSQDGEDALAGRLFPSNGKVISSGNSRQDGSHSFPYMPAVALKILAGPKPPSPAMYFKMKDGSGAYVAKENLRPDNHHPHGRKFYLHHRKSEIDKEFWKTGKSGEALRKILKQIVKIKPIPTNTTFQFHLDFENLTDLELGRLLYALRPSEAFRHKIGLGKPIGLGRVRIEPVGLFLIDRKDRYSNLSSGRYYKSWVADNNAEQYPFVESEPDHDVLKADYPREYAASRTDSIDPADLWKRAKESMDEGTLTVLESIGDPANTTEPVHYPTVVINGSEQNPEDETYVWFVANDARGRGESQMRYDTRKYTITGDKRFLPPISDGAIPTLEPFRLTPVAGNGNRQGGNRNGRNQGRRDQRPDRRWRR